MWFVFTGVQEIQRIPRDLLCTGDVWLDMLIILQNQVSHRERETFLVFGYVLHLPSVGFQLSAPSSTAVIVFHFGNRNSFLPALEMSNSGKWDTIDVHSPITLTHAEIQNVGTMLPEDRCYEYRFLFWQHCL